jgi:hypothetical protein
VVEEKNVQVGSKGVNRKALAFEKHGNFLELNETHSGYEGDPQGVILMDELGNANVEEATNNSAKETTSLKCIKFWYQETRNIKGRKKSC